MVNGYSAQGLGKLQTARAPAKNSKNKNESGSSEYFIIQLNLEKNV